MDLRVEYALRDDQSRLQQADEELVRALEVVELTGRSFAASAPVIGRPRWDTVIIGLDWETALLDDDYVHAQLVGRSVIPHHVVLGRFRSAM